MTIFTKIPSLISSALHRPLFRKICLVFLSAVLVAIGSPPIGLWPCILVAWWPLLAVVSTSTPRMGFYLGLFHGMVAYGICLHWFLFVFGAAAMPLWAIVAMFVALFCLIFRMIGGEIQRPLLKVLFAAALWTSIEYFRSELFFLRFPWITPGMALGPNWLSPIIGVYGVSFLAFLCSAAFSYRRTRPLGIVLLALVFLLGALRPGRIEPVNGKALRVAAVQCEDCSLDALIQMTEDIPETDLDLVVWPEVSVPYNIRKYPMDFDAVKSLCARKNITLLFGTVTVLEEEDGWRNTALLVNGSGVLGEYYKSRPIHFFDEGIPGDSFEPISTELGLIGTPICFDGDYTVPMRKMAALGAEFYAIPSYEARSWSAFEHLQHSMWYRIRAAENARWVVRAASSGLTHIIDPHGNEQEVLPLMEEDVLSGTIGRRSGTTLYTKWGWLFPWVLIVLTINAILWIMIDKVSKKDAPE